MILKAFSIYDAKAGVHSHPFFTVNAEVAGRIFAGLANDSATTVSKHPTDFSLFAIGSYDDEMGAFTNLPVPENLGMASQFKTLEVTNASE